MKSAIAGVMGLSFLLVSGASVYAAPDISAVLTATSASSTGKCPALIKFQGKITVSAPAKVQYKFIRSDGANAPVHTLVFAKAGSQPVSTTWTLGGPGLPEYEGWQAIQVIYPHQVQSNKAEFKVRCTAAQTRSVKEDCLSFNPGTAAVQQISGDWKIVDGSHWMFSFGAKKDEADKTLAIIRKYGLNRSCFVGRPDPSFKYLRK